MNTDEAKKIVSEIAQDIFKSRGDIGTSQARKWAPAYTYWRDASDSLTAEEINDAIHDGLRAYQGSQQN